MARAQLGAGQQDHPQPCPSHDRGSACRESAPLAGRQGHQAAGGQLPRPGRQRKERHGGRHEGGGQRQRERQCRDQGKDHQIRGLLGGGFALGAPAYEPDQPCRADDQRRPHQVELLLYTQRPVVLERRWRPHRGEVAQVFLSEMVVADIQSAVDTVFKHAVGLQWGQQDSRADRGDHADQGRGRQQPASSRSVEAAQLHRAGGAHLAPEQPGDQKA